MKRLEVFLNLEEYVGMPTTPISMPGNAFWEFYMELPQLGVCDRAKWKHSLTYSVAPVVGARISAVHSVDTPWNWFYIYITLSYPTKLAYPLSQEQQSLQLFLIKIKQSRRNEREGMDIQQWNSSHFPIFPHIIVYTEKH